MRHAIAAAFIAAVSGIAEAGPMTTTSNWVQCMDGTGPESAMCSAFAEGLLMGYQLRQDSPNTQITICWPMKEPPAAMVHKVHQLLGAAPDNILRMNAVTAIIAIASVHFPCGR